MAFNNKDLTQGGQVFFYMIRMFLQVNKIIFHWVMFAFVSISVGFFLFWNFGRLLALKMGYYYFSKLVSSFSDKGKVVVDLGTMHFEAPAYAILEHTEFILARDFLHQQLLLAIIVSFTLCFIGVLLFYRYLGEKGKKNKAKTIT